MFYFTPETVACALKKTEKKRKVFVGKASDVHAACGKIWFVNFQKGINVIVHG
jgi:hypothetical protein